MTGNPSIDGAILSILSALVVASVTTLARSLHRRADETIAYLRKREREERTRDMIMYRMAVYDEHFSTEEKLQAYQLYRAAGGNHQTKYYMDSLLGEDVDVYLEHHGKEDGR